MKMGAGIFWGAAIALIGILILINVIFGAGIPVAKIVFGLFFIYIGVRILFGGCGFPACRTAPGDVVLHGATIQGLSNQKEYTTLFGRSVLDWRTVSLEGKSQAVTVTCLFGSTEILLNRDLPVRISAEAAFGNVELPENGAAGFGTSAFQSGPVAEGEPYLAVKISAVFGAVKVRY